MRERTMVKGVATVWMAVTDMDAAVRFYSDALGLEVTQRQDEWSELKADSLTIGLNGRSEESPRGGGGAIVAFAVDDIEAAVSELDGKGVKIVGDVSEHPWGKVATFADPDGNDVQLYEAP